MNAVAAARAVAGRVRRAARTRACRRRAGTGARARRPLGMAVEARVADARDTRLAFEPARPARRRFGCGAPCAARGSAGRAGPGTPRTARAWRRCRSGCGGRPRSVRANRPRAAEHVAVAAHVLRRRLDDEVDARARSGGRGTAMRTCCRPRPGRRGDGRARSRRRDQRPRSSDWRSSRGTAPGSAPRRAPLRPPPWSVASTKSVRTPSFPKTAVNSDRVVP